MPFFADTHPDGEMPAEVLLANLLAAGTGRRGPAGVRPVDYYVGRGGRITCVLAASDVAAVRRFHAALGLPCRRIRTVAPSREPLGGPAYYAAGGAPDRHRPAGDGRDELG